MAPPAGVVHLQAYGTLAGGEKFSCGWWALPSATPTQAGLDGITGGAALAWQNTFLTTTVKALFPTSTTWLGVKGYYYNGGNAAALVSDQAISGGTGTAASSPLPNQCGHVVTLNTGIPGRSNRGRCYLPGVGVGTIANGQLSTANANTLVTAFAAMLTGFNGLSGVGFPAHAVVPSSKHGTVQTLTSCTMDTRIDIQRSRAKTQQIVGVQTHSV